MSGSLIQAKNVKVLSVLSCLVLSCLGFVLSCLLSCLVLSCLVSWFLCFVVYFKAHIIQKKKVKWFSPKKCFSPQNVRIIQKIKTLLWQKHFLAYYTKLKTLWQKHFFFWHQKHFSCQINPQKNHFCFTSFLYNMDLKPKKKSFFLFLSSFGLRKQFFRFSFFFFLFLLSFGFRENTILFLFAAATQRQEKGQTRRDKKFRKKTKQDKRQDKIRSWFVIHSTIHSLTAFFFFFSGGFRKGRRPSNPWSTLKNNHGEWAGKELGKVH